MADPAERAVLQLLKNSEEVKIAIEATILRDEEASTPGGYHELQELAISPSSESESIRIVAVVTHVDSLTGDEQGCAFILKPKTRRSATTEEIYLIDHVFPIVDGFGIVSTVPADLRHAHRPTHTLLSNGHAGSPGDDMLDISIIREEWIKSKVKEFYTSSNDVSTLRLRIGTFNVNGKLPSQDLSGWVGRSHNRDKYIPPLLALSPLAVGEVVKGNLQDSNVSKLNLSDSEGKDAKAVPSTLTAPSSSVTSLVPDNHEDDPDLIVLGFQELDLSAGALLYSTETTREDAWYTAAMAGLGEKAEMYTKVSVSRAIWPLLLRMRVRDHTNVLVSQLASKQLVGMLLIVIVKTEIETRFTQVQATSIGAGILGLMGNKGATALRLTYTPPTSDLAPSPRPAVLTFVNAHLAAFDEMYDKRNQDFHDLSRRLSFDSGIPERDASSYSSSSGTEYPMPNVPLNVFQSDALAHLAGTSDLNYRLNLIDSDVRSLLSESAQDSIPLLLQYDQVNALPSAHLPRF
ncbi:hypothetical protein EIP86_006874 [Pleurotus ostreatoroseus]|nr:hypothetical protein EIP86_006874 [Pleurotus ostreatoroseus]